MRMLEYRCGSSIHQATPASRCASTELCQEEVRAFVLSSNAIASLIDARGDVRLGNTSIRIWTKWLRGVWDIFIPCSAHNSAIPAISPICELSRLLKSMKYLSLQCVIFAVSRSIISRSAPQLFKLLSPLSLQSGSLLLSL